MGVPITFLDKYNPDQFEILGITLGNTIDYPMTTIYQDAIQHNKDGSTQGGSKVNTRAAILVKETPIGTVYYTADNADGLCECYSKKIIIRKLEDDVMNFDNLNAYEHKVLRHEIVHAFLHESGLCSNCDWADNEEMVDWVACQYPKFSDAFHVAADILRDMLKNEESEE